MEEIRCLLWLLMVFGTASPKIWTVLHYWKTPQKACEALRDSSGASQQGLPSHVVRRMHQIHAAQVDEVLARCEKQKISILLIRRCCSSIGGISPCCAGRSL